MKTNPRQVDRLFALLSDKKWHSLPAIVDRIRGYRVSAAVWILRHRYKKTIELRRKRKGEQMHVEYRLVP